MTDLRVELLLPADDMDECVGGDNNKGIEKVGEKPNFNHLDVGCHWQGVQRRDEEGGQGHQDGRVDRQDDLVKVGPVEEVGVLVDDGQDEGGYKIAEDDGAEVSVEDQSQPDLICPVDPRPVQPNLGDIIVLKGWVDNDHAPRPKVNVGRARGS